MKYPIQVLFREYFEGILAAVFLALFLRFFVVSILYIPSDKLEPGLLRGDFVVGWRLSYGFPLPLTRGQRLNAKVPQRGDLISFRFPGDEEQIIIRRVIGLPGDRVSADKGHVAVNGQPLRLTSVDSLVEQETAYGGASSYDVQNRGSWDLASLEVPANHLFVLSDNRLRVDDSRDWGFVPMQNVESEVVFIWLSIRSEQGQTQLDWERMFQWVL